MKDPFFSIVIPTKDRANLVEDLLISILDQDFDNYEIILSDNSDENLTQVMLSKYSDPRIRNIRRHELTMADNWDKAIELCQGKFMLLFSDKMLLKKGALEYLHRKIEDTQSDCITWTIDVCCDTEKAFFSRNTDQDLILSTHDLLRDMSLANIPSYIRSAFHCSSCVSVSILKKIRASHGRVSFQLNPDYTFSYHVSLSIKSIFRLSESLTILRQKDFQTGYGNGHSFFRKTQTAKSFINNNDEWFKKTNEIQDVPIHGNYFSIDTMLKDFYMVLKMYKINPEQFANFEDRIAGYYFRTFNEITHRQSMHVDMEDELVLWKKSLSKENKHIKRMAYKAIAKISLWRIKIKLISLLKKVSVLFKFFVFIRNSIHTKKAYIYQTHSDLLDRTKISCTIE
jgi:glycosyltransferase involved in cell wall biosynthesis